MCAIGDKNTRTMVRNGWVNKMFELCAKANNDHNYGKAYKEANEIADNLNIDLKDPKAQSETIFAKHAKKKF